MNILIADDHPLFREALRQLIKQTARDAVITEASTYPKLDQLLNEAASSLDILLMDLDMPGGNAYDSIADIHQRFPTLPIIVITGSDSAEVTRMAISRGAVGFLPKSLDGHSLQSALENIFSGGMSVIPPAINNGDPGLPRYHHPLCKKLTERQLQVLGLICAGDTNKMIARKLELTEGTVKLHVRAILQSLGVNNRTQAVAIARQQR